LFCWSVISIEEYFVKRVISLAVIGAATLAQGCATSTYLGAGAANQTGATRAFTGTTNEVSPVTLSQTGQAAVSGAEISIAKDVPVVEGHPLTSVVVTQCNLVVAVYMTMPDGRLLRFDSKTNTPAAQLVSIAYTATRSERVEVSCDGLGAVGFENHGAT
jgi:hypothetical protein